MKIRTGFVSNSSTTSFTCELCGETEAFHDSCSHIDFGFHICEKEHCLCEAELLDGWEEFEEPDESDYEDPKEYEKMYKRWDEAQNMCADIPSDYCPICQFQEFSQRELILYLQKQNPTPINDILTEIKKINKRRKKVYPGEEISYILKTRNQSMPDLITEIKDKFKTYDEFHSSIYIR